MDEEQLVSVPEALASQPLPFGPGWPGFIGHDPVGDALMPRVREAFTDYSLVLVTQRSNAVAAGGWGVPLVWDGSISDLPRGWDGALQRSIADLDAGRRANTFCAWPPRW